MLQKHVEINVALQNGSWPSIIFSTVWVENALYISVCQLSNNDPQKYRLIADDSVLPFITVESLEKIDVCSIGWFVWSIFYLHMGKNECFILKHLLFFN